ncbi:pentatricopeptide repeat-containing protein At2g33680-like [Dioscorea cayenensis subsp. rotundata]|uniref:Pentatricopeptide repeat-containing protein At2g33680-like n=1 Tax=Dioscorea cayennensis subsp. rotundata TaxID=55577 RepID=A0AB40B7Q3_DIOCR|nr:pentatricopeptide repeat-containing protein At2g33680-like [Dioscorea cayenensis subsp. rotundata]
MYAKYGDLETAGMMFRSRTDRNTVSWTAMISGFIQNGLHEKALTLSREMKRAGAIPDRATFSSILRASACLALLELRKQFHSYIIQSSYMSSVFCGSAMLDLYAKCSFLTDTVLLFNKMPERNIVSWNTMIAAYAQNGQGSVAFLTGRGGEQRQRVDGMLGGIISAIKHAAAMINGSGDWQRQQQRETSVACLAALSQPSKHATMVNNGIELVKIPLDQNLRLYKEDGKLIDDPSIYRRLIGRLMYLTLTRLDLSYSIQLLSQFMDKLRDAHLIAAHKVIRYIKIAPVQGLFYPSSSTLQLNAYSDSDWGLV